jgi:hypothetical protein
MRGEAILLFQNNIIIHNVERMEGEGEEGGGRMRGRKGRGGEGYGGPGQASVTLAGLAAGHGLAAGTQGWQQDTGWHSRAGQGRTRGWQQSPDAGPGCVLAVYAWNASVDLCQSIS